jgi:membrane protease YdiL (CAAX protease family)
MTTITPSARHAPGAAIKDHIIRHPVVAFYLLAFAGSWLAWLPLVLDGFGLLPFGVPRAPFMIVGTFAGPALAAFVMTAVTEGRPGVRQLLQSYVQYRVGIRWYLIVFFWNPIVLLLTASVVLAVSPLSLLARMWPLILSVYLPAIVEILVAGQLWEQVGWRGFALPRLQRKYGPLAASFIVGARCPVAFTRLFLRGRYSRGPRRLDDPVVSAALRVDASAWNTGLDDLHLDLQQHARQPVHHYSLPYVDRCKQSRLLPAHS